MTVPPMVNMTDSGTLWGALGLGYRSVDFLFFLRDGAEFWLKWSLFYPFCPEKAKTQRAWSENDLRIRSRKERQVHARGRYCLENSPSELAHILSHGAVLNKYYCV